MNIVFFGSDNFAVPSLRALLATKHRVSCVVTQPDKKRGRGLSLTETQVKNLASETHLKIYQPLSINGAEAQEFLKDLNADLFIVVAYGQILSENILDIPKIFALNVHASLLPKYRGAAPINWAIINGEKKTGVTVIKMTQKMDAGPIILQKTIDIHDSDTAWTLEDRLSWIGAELLLNCLDAIENNNYNLNPQDENKVTLAPKLKKGDGLIDWSRPVCQIHNLIRGCIGWPGAFTYYKGKLLKIYNAKAYPFIRLSVYPLPGEILQVSKEGLLVATGKDNLVIEELQIEGKRRMKVEEFIAGHKISAGEILGKK